ncbi:hypothetical protein [Uliginosibacterium sediminicola]|uniref:PsbP protein n=1 Tax=Uliginosibacterium sediminicola TaxID=2024550 RepID=A0ABU9YYB0_9RHOO
MKLVAIAMILFFVSACAHIGNQKERRISYGDDLVVFQLPDSWEAHIEEEGNGIYFNQAIDSNALRLSVISITSKPDNTLQVKDLLTKNHNNEKISHLTNGNLVKVYDEQSVENGVPISTRFWEVSHLVNSHCGRIAIFSYTTPIAYKDKAATEAALSYLDKSIKSSNISSSSCRH